MILTTQSDIVDKISGCEAMSHASLMSLPSEFYNI